MKRNPLKVLLLACTLPLLFGCAKKGEEAGHHGEEIPTFQQTLVVDQTELFVEYPALILGADAPFAVHLTQEAENRPVAEGAVTVTLAGGGAPPETFRAEPSEVRGIYRPVARPAHAGKRGMTLELLAGGASRVFDLGEVTVFQNPREALAAGGESQDPGGHIAYLKEQQWKAEFAVAPVELRRLQRSIPALGSLRPRRGGEGKVIAPLAGFVQAEGGSTVEVGASVRKGQVLARLLPKPEGVDPAALVQDEEGARARFDFARTERERVEALFTKGAVSERRLQEAIREESQARAGLESAERRVSFYGAGAQGAASGIPLRAPISGTLVSVEADSGTFAEQGQVLFRVVDLDRLWLEVRVPEAEAVAANQASGAWFEAPGLKAPVELSPEARVGSGGTVDPVSRTVPVLFAVENEGHILPEGLSVRANLLTGDAVEMLSVPVSAVVDESGQAVVFVQVGGESFERRPVRLGIRSRGFFQVLDGVFLGERIVIRGAYAVKLAASSAQLPAHGHAH